MATKKTASKSATPAPKSEVETPKPAAKKAAVKKVAAKKTAPSAANGEKSPAAAANVEASPATPAAAKKTAVKPSLDAIARAAYLNYRRRVEQSLPGNSQGDWLEAERQFAEQG